MIKKIYFILFLICFSFIANAEKQKSFDLIENNSIIQILDFYSSSYNRFYDKEQGIKKINSIFSNFLNNNFSVEQIENTDLFRIVVNNKNYYMLADSSFIFSGQIMKLDLNDNDFTRYTISDKEKKYNRNLLRVFNLKDFIRYENRGDKYRGSLIVFSDYSCPFCKKYHYYNLDKILDLGFDVLYAPYLKNPKNLKVKKNMKKIYCQSDNKYKKELMDLAFSNLTLFESTSIKDCDYSEVYMDNLFKIGEYLRVQGTPTTFFYNGNRLSGFIPLKQYIPEIRGNN